MNDFRPDPPPVYHGESRDLSRPEECPPSGLPSSGVPRIFSLTRDDDDSGEPLLCAWGMLLPDGRAVTVTGDSSGLGKWSSPDRAAQRMDADLEWL